MPDIANRDRKEAEIRSKLEEVWDKISRNQPEDITPELIIEALKESLAEPMWQLWWAGHKQVESQFGVTSSDRAIMAAFLLFWSEWAESVSQRWTSRTREWMQDKRINDMQREAARSGSPATARDGRPAPREVFETRPPGRTVEQARARRESIQEVVEPMPSWRNSRDIVMPDHAFEKYSVEAVTNTNSRAEIDAVRDVRSKTGGVIVGIWRVSPGACPHCLELKDTRENVWRLVAPDGPMLHRNCRCFLDWRLIVP